MFDLNKDQRHFLTSFGVAMTFIVTLAACSHEPIPSENASIPAEELSTPDVQQPLVAENQTLPNEELPSALPSSHKRHRAKHHHSRLAHHHKKQTAAVARVEIDGPTPTAPVGLSDNALAAAAAQPDKLAPPTPDADALQMQLNEPSNSKRGLILGLGAIILASGGLLWFALRKSDRRGKRARSLVFNA